MAQFRRSADHMPKMLKEVSKGELVMNHADYWTIAKLIQEKAVAAGTAWDLSAAKTLNALALEFMAMGDKAEKEYLAEKAEWDANQFEAAIDAINF
jgi:hypothetical protein